MKIGITDSGSTIALKQNELLEIVLPGNPTTGYKWESGSDTVQFLVMQEWEFRPQHPKPGSAGNIVLRYKATSPGAGTLKLIYRRPFGPITPTDKVFEISFRVTD